MTEENYNYRTSQALSSQPVPQQRETANPHYSKVSGKAR